MEDIVSNMVHLSYCLFVAHNGSCFDEEAGDLKCDIVVPQLSSKSSAFLRHTVNYTWNRLHCY
jgi:hypothetical protein